MLYAYRYRLSGGQFQSARGAAGTVKNVNTLSSGSAFLVRALTPPHPLPFASHTAPRSDPNCPTGPRVLRYVGACAVRREPVRLYACLLHAAAKASSSRFLAALTGSTKASSSAFFSARSFMRACATRNSGR